TRPGDRDRHPPAPARHPTLRWPRRADRRTLGEPMSTPAIHVLLVDDHPVVRAGLRALLEQEPTITVTGEADNGEEALRALADPNLVVDVVMMDLQMGPGMGGIEATGQITAAHGPPVLVLTTYDTQADITAALAAGATGYL